MADGGQAGLLDVEKELTCSICTEILFQPLTLLDCLHTFCGSCLQEWFAWQATQASRSKPNPYTCPSCRASVRDTRPNATVTTLLEMYLQANAGRGRSQEERDQLRQKYKPGDQVLPRLPARNDDSDDERMLAEVREMSLREVGVRETGSYQRGTRHRIADRERDSHSSQQRRSHQQSNDNPRALAEAGSQRQIGHQSSLRSLMSNSEIDSSEMEEEILRLRMRIVGAIDMGQDLGMHDLHRLSGQEKVREDGQEELHGTQLARQEKARIRHVKCLILLFPDRVFYKLIRRLQVTNAGLRVSREGNLPHPPNHRQEDVPSQPKTKHLNLRSICPGHPDQQVLSHSHVGLPLKVGLLANEITDPAKQHKEPSKILQAVIVVPQLTILLR
ncbi:MAG: hypothetical protein Q9174_002463 [Haloplaca sp. 1 TL-2023]